MTSSSMRKVCPLELPSDSVRECLEQATSQYEADLVGSPAEAHLAARGIPLATARTYRLGYVASPIPGDEDMKGRLAIPYQTTMGGVVNMRFRALQGDGPRYLSHAGTHNYLFNVRALHRATDTIAVCEGELDTVVADGLCDIHAIGVAGASNWMKHYPLLLEDYRRVVVLADGDAAGREFAKKVVSTLNNAVAVPMPDGADVNEVFLSEGPDAIRRRAGIGG